MRLHGERQGKPLVVDVPFGFWKEVEVRPVLPVKTLEAYRRCQKFEGTGQAPRAIDCWAEVRTRLPQNAPGHLKSWISYRSGRSLAGRGALPQAEKAFEEALAEPTDGLFNIIVRLRLAELYEQQGRPEAAEATIRRALADQSSHLPKSRIAATILKELGALSLGRGDLEAAEHFTREALRVEQGLAPDSLEIAGTLQTWGVIHHWRGDRQLAEEAVRRSLDHLARLGQNDQQIAVFTLGVLARLQGDMVAARSHYSQVLASARGSGLYLEELAVLAELGVLAMDLGELSEAEEYLQEVLNLARRFAPVSTLTSKALLNLGNLMIKQGELDRAKSYLQDSLALSRRVAPFSIRRAEALQALASIARRTGSANQAEHLLAEAIEVLEEQVEHLGGTLEEKGRFRAQQREIYRDTLQLQLDLGRPREAFHIWERYRAWAFLALLGERDLAFADVPPTLDRERRTLLATYDRNQLQLATLDSEADCSAIAELESAQADLRRRRDEIAAEIRRAAPRVEEVTQPEALTFEQVRAAIEPGTILLSYSIGKERSHLFVVGPGKDLQVVTLEIGEAALHEEVERLRQLIDQARTGAGLDAAGLDWFSRRLYDQLIAPAEPWIAVGERILLMPDGPLHLLPFGALIRTPAPTSPARGPAERSRQYLVEWKPLHTALSGSVYAELKKRRRPAGEAAATEWTAFGDPSFPERFARTEPHEIGEMRLRSLATRAQLRWQRLPQSRREVEGIADLYPEAVRHIYLGREATEERAKSVGRETRILHFATHGFVDDRSPFDSGLVLAIPDELVEGRDNGLLQVWEIFERVRLDADLVVLSACETGLGEIRGGEGIIGLTRAFQVAGARSVLTTLWRVEDAATAQLMQSFYRHLRAGSAKAEALRSAQLELLRASGDSNEAGTSAPYFWAAVQLVGDDR